MSKQREIEFSKTLSHKPWFKKHFKNPKKILKVGTLFSGIGAIEHGLQRLKIKSKIMFAGDIDPHVKNTYFGNYDLDEKDWHDDINNFSAEKYKYNIDLLVGGSPCQSFSMAGNRGGLEDTRGTLFYEFMRIVKECRPRVVIFENVKGVLSHDKGNTWKIMQQAFNELSFKGSKNPSYKWDSKILNSADFGIPQSRNRLFVVGVRKDLISKLDSNSIEFPTPIDLEKTMQDFLEDEIDSSFYMTEKGVKFVTKISNQRKHYTQVNGKIALCQKANQQTNWHGDFIFESIERDLKYDEFIFYVKQVEDKYFLSDTVKKYVLSSGTKSYKAAPGVDPKIARTLLQSMHKMHRSGVDNYVTSKGRLRRLTPRECLRLMGFRDSFKQISSDTQTYRQAVNSIVVDVLMAIIKQIDITKFIK